MVLRNAICLFFYGSSACSVEPFTLIVARTLISGSRTEVFVTLEKDLIRQVQMCDRNREYFTRLGDVSQVNKYENLSNQHKRDLVGLRQAAKVGDPIPRSQFLHYVEQKIFQNRNLHVIN